MHSPKEAAAEIIRTLPDNASFDDIMFRLYVRSQIEEGLADIEAGRLMDQDEAEKRMEKWLAE